MQAYFFGALSYLTTLSSSTSILHPHSSQNFISPKFFVFSNIFFTLLNMATSLSSVNNIDLNVAPTAEPIVVPNVQPDLHVVHLEVSVAVNNIDLNVTFTSKPIVMHNVQLDLHVVYPEVPVVYPDIPANHPNEPVVYPNVWQPIFVFDNCPITIHHSVMLNDSIAMAMAKGLVSPRDQRLLADRSNADAINNSLAFSIQGATSISDMARRLSVKNEEIKILRNQVGVLK